jgi:ADP-ribosylglycohydrolase
MVAQALLESPSDPLRLQRALARRFRWWLASLPAGVGFATLRAIIKLWLGISPRRSGVYSAGNGAAMRSAIIGVYFADDPSRRDEFARASSEITHSDPRAILGARAVADAAAWMCNDATRSGDPCALLISLAELDPDSRWTELVLQMRAAFERQCSVQEFSGQIGCRDGVSGYVFQTVPVAIYSALRHRDDFESALCAVIQCGGDTDTVGAITGALVGARLGINAIPAPWRDRIVEWPRSVDFLIRLATALDRQRSTNVPVAPVHYFWPAIPLRNAAFTAIILAHGFRRVLPPY